ncbi:hypothetical protein T484DRAFT_3628516 [Baffinella frigidus]|nr:hypothetical protein T484DRAFT_3628516 [Cryptophyta sp. CCMP2293]
MRASIRMQSKDLCLRTDKIAARENAIAERENAVIANNAAFENTRALFANERTAFEAACAQLVEASDQRLSEAHAELNSLKKQSAKREKVFTKAQAGFDQRGVIFENERTAVEVACAKLVDASDQRLTAAHAEVNSLKKQSVEQEQVLTKAHAEFDKTKLWSDGVTPLVLDAFVIYLWVTPLTDNILRITYHDETPNFMTACSALYATAFFTFTAARSVTLKSEEQSDEFVSGMTIERDGYRIAMHWLLFIVGSVHHTIWTASHAHTCDPPYLLLQLYRFLPGSIVRAIPTVLLGQSVAVGMATFRTAIVLLFMLVHETPSAFRGVGFPGPIDFLHSLSLFITISTFTAWVHCQHQNHNNLRSILTASVVASACDSPLQLQDYASCHDSKDLS